MCANKREYSLGKEEFQGCSFPGFSIPAPFSRGEEGFLSLLSFDEQGHCVGLFYDG